KNPISTLGSAAAAFAAKLNADGTSLFYSGGLGSTALTKGTGIVIDAGGNAYVTGTADPSLPFPAVNPLPANLGGAAFLMKLGATADAATVPKTLMATTFGGATALPEAIALDPGGHIYIAGSSAGDLPVTSGAVQSSFRGGTADGFVAKIGST